MAIFVCMQCGFRYDTEKGDPARGIPPGTAFSALPDDWRCPVCGAEKTFFKESRS